MSNMALRKVAIPNDFGWAIWVSCLKATPAALLAWIIIGWRASRGLQAMPPRKLWAVLIAGGFIQQFGGNVMFQWALGIGGLVITVPLVFATIITSAAWLGKIFLGDQLSIRTAMAIATLLASIVIIAMGAAETAGDRELTVSSISLACVVACLAGIAYGANGVLIRYVLTSQPISLSATLVMFSSTGAVVLSITALATTGPARMLATTGEQWFWLICAGVMNAVAFFAIGGALKRLSINRANLLNSTQNAMCALAGVLLFRELITLWLVIGCGLTIAGIVLMDHKDQSNKDA